jgi:hypothetical protein
MTVVNMHPIGEPGEMRTRAEYRRIAALRQMTAEQLLHLGTHKAVHLKSAMCDGEMIFVLFGADGAPLASADTVETAMEMVAEHGLEFITVH